MVYLIIAEKRGVLVAIHLRIVSGGAAGVVRKQTTDDFLRGRQWTSGLGRNVCKFSGVNHAVGC